MRCLPIGLCVVLLLVSPDAWAQQGTAASSTAVGTDLAERGPAENAKGGAVSNRAPGQIVRQALARHRESASLRLGAQRTGETWLLAPEPSSSSGLADSLSNLLGGLSPNLINSFLNSGLGGALGGQTGGTSGSGGSSLPGGSFTGGSGSVGNSGTSGSNSSSLPPEVIAMLQGAGINASDLNQKSREGTSRVSDANSKTSSLTQQTSVAAEEPDFLVRWADAMLSTVFTTLAIGVQTPDFIGLLKDALRPIFFPQDASADESDGASSADGAGDSGDSSDGGDGGDDGGGSSDGGDDSGGSAI